MNSDAYIAPVFNRFLDMVQRHVNYVFSTYRYTENLRNKRDVLNARKDDMNVKIEGAERRSQKPTSEVVVWQRKVVDMLNKIDTVLSAHETRSCVCAICSDYETAHRCDDMLQEVDELLERGSSYLNAEMVDCDNSNDPISMPYVVPESQELYFAEALKYIEDDNSKANIIGIWGPGGVGKTTLLTKIHNSCLGTSSMFTPIIWIVTSSEQSNILKVQSEIVKNLGLNESDDAQSQARIIHKFLVNKDFLLFIDDLWEAVDLLKVGVPNPYEANQYGKKRKVVFTTRSKIVCGNMEAKKIIEVKCLDPTQSWILFKEKVGEDILSDNRITEFAKGVAEECKGLPLALTTIGRAMYMKSNPDDWKITLNLLKNSQYCHVLDVDKQLLPVLKISYDHLATDQLRKCFLSISLWPEDYNIEKKELIEFWMGLDLIDNFESIDDAYQIGHSLIGNLQDARLLEDHGVTYVKMHDVLRDLALWLASGCGKNKNKWMVKAGIQLKVVHSIQVKWSEAECISLMHNKLKELPSDIPTCPNLLTLVLKYNTLTCESILNCFHKFHSLTYLDLSCNNLNSIPESICDLTELQYLNMSHTCIRDLPIKLRNLKKLRYLILRENHILKVPIGVFSELPKLLVLDMFNLFVREHDPCKYSPFPVEELKNIENKLLYLGMNVWSEQELSKLMLLSYLCIQVLCIEGLHNTSFHFMSMIRNPQCLKELYIQNSGDGLLEIVFNKNEIHRNITSLNLETLDLHRLRNLRRIIWKDITPKKLFVELRKVHIYDCGHLEDITWVINLPSLRYLSIIECKNMRIAINNNVDTVSTFPSLEVFTFIYGTNLEKISAGSLAFPQLKKLLVSGCHLLKTLSFDFKTAPKLTRIDGQKEWWEKVEWEDDNSRSHFNQFFVDGTKFRHLFIAQRRRLGD